MAKRNPPRQLKRDVPEPPPGCQLIISLGNLTGAWLGRPSWSPDGRLLAVGSENSRVSIWRATDGELEQEFLSDGPIATVSWSPDGGLLSAAGRTSVQTWDLQAHGEHSRIHTKDPWNYGVSWSPDGRMLAVGARQSLALYEPHIGKRLRVLMGNPSRVISVAWSPDGQGLASTSEDGSIRLWHVKTGQERLLLKGHSGEVYGAAWSPDGRLLASASEDRTLRLWDVESGTQLAQLEGHTDRAHSVSFSHDGRLLASQGRDDTVRLWRRDTWEQVGILSLPPHTSGAWPPGATFHPHLPLLATSTDGGLVHIWTLEPSELLHPERTRSTAHYSNSKVVLVGNTSVGKSGLGLVLAGRMFRPTESTHGRHIWTLKSETVAMNKQVSCIRETLLWDLAGQPGYRLLHQLHLHDVAVALVLFDSRSEIEPFAGVSYWAQALNEATHGHPLKKFLVASRTDRGGPKVSQERIDEIQRRHGFDGYFETSARRGTGVEELREAILTRIPWDKLPRVSTSELFLSTRNFLVTQKKKGVAIATQAELLDHFRQRRKKDDATDEVFATCLGGLESTGLIRRLAFGQYVLLQPELLDAYSGWLAFAAREQPDGLGYIPEREAIAGNFPMDEDRPLQGTADEKILLLATTQEVVARNIAYRQDTLKGTMLVFPSELNAELPNYPGGYALAMAFQFRGPISGIYATLAVTLLNSLAFKKKDLFKNAALYEGPQKQVCGFAIEYPDKTDDALGRLTVFFGSGTAKDVRLLFLRFINQQLERLALESSVQRERIYHCDACNITVPPNFVRLRIERGEKTVVCPVCTQHLPIDDLAEESEVQDEQLARLNAEAEEERTRQTRLTILDERRRENEFHVFLCHNSKDKPAVRQLASALLEHGILAWVDDKGTLAGDRFSKKLESTIDRIGVLAVLIGPQGLGQWQEMEYHAALQRSIEERDEQGRPRLRLIPVLLPGVGKEPVLPLFLRGLHHVDLRGGLEDREQLRTFVEAITTKRDLF